MIRCVAFVLAVLAAGAATAQSVQLAPYKDRMFALPRVIESRDDGAYRRVDYREGRDVNGRDDIPGRKVRGRYISMRPRGSEAELTLATAAGPVRYRVAGKQTGARVVSIYVHGRGGDRRQGMNDRSFGGNFNRLKNLMVRNGGLHVSPDMPEDPSAGANLVEALMARHGGRRNVVVACGSQGAAVCYELLRSATARPFLAGIALLGGFADRSVLSAPPFRDDSPVPVYLGHGSRDQAYDVGRMEALYGAMRSAGYPARMVVFESGIHGTPIRMTDWRETINWMLRGGR